MRTVTASAAGQEQPSRPPWQSFVTGLQAWAKKVRSSEAVGVGETFVPERPQGTWQAVAGLGQRSGRVHLRIRPMHPVLLPHAVTGRLLGFLRTSQPSTPHALRSAAALLRGGWCAHGHTGRPAVA